MLGGCWRRAGRGWGWYSIIVCHRLLLQIQARISCLGPSIARSCICLGCTGCQTIFSLLSHFSHHFLALNSLISADVPLRNYSLTHEMMERMVNSRLVWYLERNKLISPAQCGFCKRRSTIDQLMCLETTNRLLYYGSRKAGLKTSILKHWNTITLPNKVTVYQSLEII